MNVLIKASAISLFYLLLSNSVFAMQITGCHCFQNRQFDPAQPGAVDPYLLATTQNSFLAAIFGIDKKQIVQAKMRGGASGDNLWIAHFIGLKTGADAKDLLDSRKTSGSWKKALEQIKVNYKLLGSYFERPFAQDISDKEMSSMIVDQMIIDYFGAKKSDIKIMRSRGAQNKEIILSSFLYRKTNRSASFYYSSVSSGQSTWGTLLHGLEIEAKEMGVEINKMLIK